MNKDVMMIVTISIIIIPIIGFYIYAYFKYREGVRQCLSAIESMDKILEEDDLNPELRRGTEKKRHEMITELVSRGVCSSNAL